MGNKRQCPVHDVNTPCRLCLIDHIAKLESQLDDRNKRIEEMEAQICDECSPDDRGWAYNAIEGRVPCTCIIETEAWQELQAQLEQIVNICTALYTRFVRG